MSTDSVALLDGLRAVLPGSGSLQAFRTMLREAPRPLATTAQAASSMGTAAESAVGDSILAAADALPASRISGFHGTDLDPRVLALYGTVGAARRAGLYTPTELALMVAAGAAEVEWEAAQSLRFSIFALAIPHLAASLGDSSLAAADYAAAIAALVQQVANLEVAVY